MDETEDRVKFYITLALCLAITIANDPRQRANFLRLVIFCVKPIVLVLWRLRVLPSGGRLPGQLQKDNSESNSNIFLISGFPLEVVKTVLLPFLSTRDVVALHSLVSDDSVTALLRDRLVSTRLMLTKETVGPAVHWMHARQISPKKMVVAACITEAKQLRLLSDLVSDTESFVLNSSAAFHLTGIMLLLWRFGENLRELDLRQFAMRDEALREIWRLKQLRVLHFHCGPDYSPRCLAITLSALPLLRDFGMHDCLCGLEFRAEHAAMIGAHFTKLTSLTLTTLYIDPVYTPDPLKSSFLVNMCPHLGNLQSLDLSSGLDFLAHDARVLAQHCSNLTRLTLYHVRAEPAFASALTELMHKFARLQYLNVGKMAGCDNDFITAVARHCPDLRELRMEHTACPNAAIHALALHSPPLETLVCTTSPILTEAALEALRKVIPGLCVIAEVDQGWLAYLASGGTGQAP